MRFALPILLVALALAPAPAAAQLDQLLRDLGRGLGQPAGLTDARVAAGLKEALQIGTGNAVNFTGRLDGYFRNEAIKILMPERLRSLDQGLRLVGYGPQLDDFVLSMNRAAERAAPAAKQIFWDGITAMTFDDARKILGGPDTAATDYFREKTSDRLATAFRPTVEQAIQEVGVTRQYQELVGRAQAIPFLRLESLDLNQYVVGKAMGGLFFVLGEEERKIRRDPAARVTDLLRDVFGRR